jgi:hypothetical protein
MIAISCNLPHDKPGPVLFIATAEGNNINPFTERVKVNIYQGFCIDLLSQQYPSHNIRNDNIFHTWFGDFHPELFSGGIRIYIK